MATNAKCRIFAACLVTLLGAWGLPISAAVSPVCSNQVGISISDCADAGIRGCRAELAQTPRSLPTRLALCDLLAADNQRDAARRLLQEGLELHAGDSFAINIIRRASSLIEESGVTLNTGPDIDVLDEYMLLRCQEYQSESHCRDLVRRYPDLPAPYLVLGDLSSAAGKHVEAINYYRTAQAKGAPASDVSDKLANSMQVRESALRRCYREATLAALEICRRHLIAGLDDQGRIELRIGDLYLLNENYQQAEDWFNKAQHAQAKARLGLSSALRACTTNGLECDVVVRQVGDTDALQPLLAVVDNVCTANPNLITGKCAPAVQQPAAPEQPVVEVAAPPDPDARLARMIDVCEAEAVVMGWHNALTCYQVATASLSTATYRPDQDRIRREIDSSLIAACENAVAASSAEEASSACDALMRQVFLEQSAVRIARLMDVQRSPDTTEALTDTNDPVRVDASNRYVVTY